MKRKHPMPRYYAKNIARHAQRKCLARLAERRRGKTESSDGNRRFLETILEKNFQDGNVAVIGSASQDGIDGRTVKIVLADEMDGRKQDG